MPSDPATISERRATAYPFLAAACAAGYLNGLQIATHGLGARAAAISSAIPIVAGLLILGGAIRQHRASHRLAFQRVWRGSTLWQWLIIGLCMSGGYVFAARSAASKTNAIVLAAISALETVIGGIATHRGWMVRQRKRTARELAGLGGVLMGVLIASGFLFHLPDLDGEGFAWMVGCTVWFTLGILLMTRFAERVWREHLGTPEAARTSEVWTLTTTGAAMLIGGVLAPLLNLALDAWRPSHVSTAVPMLITWRELAAGLLLGAFMAASWWYYAKPLRFLGADVTSALYQSKLLFTAMTGLVIMSLWPAWGLQPIAHPFDLAIGAALMIGAYLLLYSPSLTALRRRRLG